MLALTSEQRTRESRLAFRTAKLLEVYHAAKRLADGMRRVQPGVYEVEPALLLVMRTSLTEAGLVLRKERNHDA